MILVENLKMQIGYKELDLILEIAKKFDIKPNDINKIEIVKESIDARRKPNIYYNVNVAFDTLKTNSKLRGAKQITISHEGIEKENIKSQKGRPVIIGFGPAGMFMGLKLAKCGLKPIILEQGDEVDERQRKIDEFWAGGKLDVYSNVHFGEGGAGTFSDGKLNSNISNEFCKIVTNELIKHGAPKEIYYKSKPHIGTDNLRKVVKSIREEIISLGGEIRFKSRLTAIYVEDDKVCKVKYENVEDKEEYSLDTNCLILAIGHSAKQVFKLLKELQVNLKQKPFAMGVRIEQKQSELNIAQYAVNDTKLPSADYKLVEHLDNGRSVFTFCMCPGGEVVASSSDEGTIVTNGMSYFARDKENANSAILVNVDPKDFGNDNDVLAGFAFQEKYEKLAFELGGKNYSAPVETVGSFLGKSDNSNHINPTYKPNVTYTKIEKCLPEFVTESIRLALPKMDKKIKGFADEKNVLTAVESRSSCPCQIVRGDNFMTNKIGLFAVGEGSGYAGGIMSSAQDSLKVSKYVIEYLKEK